MKKLSFFLLMACAWFGSISDTWCQTTKYWDRGANSDSWEDGNNWNPNGVPGTSDLVVLDNSLRAGTYKVDLENSSSIIIARLTITPNLGNTITLNIPTGNTNVPALSVGD